MRVVEVGQYLVTRDAGEFQQTVACRAYTIPRDDKASQPKGWIRGNMRIGLVFEVTTSFQHFKYGIEIRIESVNKDNSHSWVRISYGTVKYSYNLSKKVVNLLRHNQKLHREEDGAIQIYKLQFHLRDHHSQRQNWSDDRWIACLAAGGGPKRRYQYCSDFLGSIIYRRALQGHSGSNLIDPTIQDNVLIGP